jgi:hypothetical protein
MGRLPWTVGWNGYMRHPLIRRPPRQEYCTAIAMKLFNIAHSRIDHHGRSAVNIF